MMRLVPLVMSFFEKRDREDMTDNKSKDDERIADLIDQNLKMVYSDLVQEQLPDRFKDLLDVLKAQDAEQKGNS